MQIIDIHHYHEGKLDSIEKRVVIMERNPRHKKIVWCLTVGGLFQVIYNKYPNLTMRENIAIRTSWVKEMKKHPKIKEMLKAVKENNGKPQIISKKFQ